jgi:hypothetical protein
LKVLFLSLYPLLESSMMCILPFHTDTMNNQRYITFIHVTDLKMVKQSSRSGVRDSSTLVMISGATSVPEVLKLTISTLVSFGVTQLVLMSLEKHSHFQFRLTDSKTLSKTLSFGIITIQISRNCNQILHHFQEEP